MRNLWLGLIAVSLTLPVSAQTPPVAEKIPHVTKIHGVELHDDYFWMRQKDNPKVAQHLEAENRYTEAVTRPTEALREKLYQEMVARIQETDSQPPLRKGQYFYFTRTEKGKQYPIHCRYPLGHKDKTVDILDLNQLAVGHSFLAVGDLVVSDDGNWLAYSLDTTGYRQFRLYVKDLRNGQVLPDKAERVTSVCWARDNRTLYYVTEDDVSKRANQCWRHRLGEQEYKLLYEEKDEIFDVTCYRSRDRQLICLRSKAKTSDETRTLDADGEAHDFQVYLPRKPGHEYSLDHRQGYFYVLTNQDALNYRLVRASDAQPRAWTEVVPTDPRRKLDDFYLFDKFIALPVRQEGTQEIMVLGAQGKPLRIPMAEPLHELEVSGGQPFDSEQLRYNYESPVTPSTVIEYNVSNGHFEVLKKTVVNGYKPEDYRCERLWITARDGTRVPLSVVRRADVPWGKQPVPMLLYGYGSYGVNYDPGFSSPLISLMDRGVTFAIVHIRGGGEMGEAWRQAGRMLTKLNTFYDFVDAAESLSKQGLTQPSQLIASGASAGGLLMGVAANLRPDLFRALIVKVPFVDVLNTMLDATIPLTTVEYIEWGNPNEKKYFDYMARYSPYDNVKAKAYPSMLVEISLNDSQVPYWEGAKLAAKLRDMKTDKNQILVKVNMAAGHGGPSGRYAHLRETAFDYAYVLQQLGLTTP